MRTPPCRSPEKDIGYLDDRRFAEGYATARVENEGFGRMRVLNDLRAHRVSGEMADQAVERAIGEKSEAELIDAFIERRMHSVVAGGRIEDERKLAAAYRKLRRAGFTSGPILSALKRTSRPARKSSKSRWRSKSRTSRSYSHNDGSAKTLYSVYSSALLVWGWLNFSYLRPASAKVRPAAPIGKPSAG